MEQIVGGNVESLEVYLAEFRRDSFVLKFLLEYKYKARKVLNSFTCRFKPLAITCHIGNSYCVYVVWQERALC